MDERYANARHSLPSPFLCLSLAPSSSSSSSATNAIYNVLVALSSAAAAASLFIISQGRKNHLFIQINDSFFIVFPK